MIKKMLLGFSAAVAGLLIYVATMPDEMKISREMVINAPAEAIFPFINNNQKADEWMPWKDSDPHVKVTYSGPAEGVGAKSSWISDGQMGVGEALVVESEPNKMVRTQLTYTKPMAMQQLAEISLTPAGAGTLVRWSVSGKSPFIARLMCVFMNMEKMVGQEFEKGLTKLKGLTEGAKS